jgi:uncharacterized protein (DUF2252 family)
VRETHTDHGMPIRAALDQMLGAYIDTLPVDRRRLLARYRIIDAARKVVGVGSVGTGCWVILLEGVDNEDPLFLQVNEAQPSVLAPYVDIAMAIDNHGQWVWSASEPPRARPTSFSAGARSTAATSTSASSPT